MEGSIAGVDGTASPDADAAGDLARAVAQSYVDSRARLGFPMAPKAWADEVVAQIEKKSAEAAAKSGKAAEQSDKKTAA